MAAADVASLRQAITKAESSKSDLKKLNKLAPSVEQNAGTAKNAGDSARLTALAAILKQPMM